MSFMSKVLQAILKRALSGGEGPQTPLLTAKLFWFQYSDISKIFWIETLCSVLVYIPKVVHGSKILRKRFFPGEVLHRSILWSRQLVWGGQANSSALAHHVFQINRDVNRVPE